MPLANLPLNRYIAHAAPVFHQDHQLNPLKRDSRISLLPVTAQQPLYSQSFSPASFHPQVLPRHPHSNCEALHREKRRLQHIYQQIQCFRSLQDPVQSPCCTKQTRPSVSNSTAHVHCTTPRNAPPIPFSPLRPTYDAYEGSSSTQELSPLMQQV